MREHNLQSPLSNRRSAVRLPVLEAGLLALSALFLLVAPLPVAVATVAGTGFVLALLVRPQLGLWLLPLSVPFGSIRQLPVAGLRLGATEILIGLTLVVWIGREMAQRRLRLEAPPLLVPLALLWGAMLLSATGMYAVPPTAKELVKWAEIVLVYVLTYNMTGRRQAAIVVSAALLIAGSLSALHGVAGSVLHVGPPQFAILGGRLYRAFGTFGQPNPFGGYMNHSLPIAASLLVAVLVNARTGADGDSRLRAGYLALLGMGGVLGAGLALSWSRGAWLGAAAGLLTVAMAWAIAILGSQASERAGNALRRRVVLWLWLAIAGLIAFLLVGGFSRLPAPIIARVDSTLATFTTLDARGADITDANFATLERVAHWQAAWDMWRDHFWTGVGIGNYEAAYPDYRLPKWPYALGHAHNIYFNLGAEIGFIGLGAYLLFVAWAMWHCWRVAWQCSEPAARGVAIGVLGVLVALAVHNFFDNMYVHAMGVHLALALGLVSVLGAGDRGAAGTRQRRLPVPRRR